MNSRESRPTGAVTQPDDPPSAYAPPGRGFHDRRDAGRRLAGLLERYRAERPVVVGMPRGGVPVAAEVARALDAPLDVVLVRKIGAPSNPEYALGALAEGGVQVLSEEAVRAFDLSEAQLRRLTAEVERELEARTRLYRGARPALDVAGRTVILVDDGLATGRSAQAAIRSLRTRGAARVILAVPVAAPSSAAALRGEVDELVAVEMPEDLWAVGFWYEDFRPTSDEEVAAILTELGSQGADDAASQLAGASGGPPSARSPAEAQVAITAAPGLVLKGDLAVPPAAKGIVVFVHGSGSSRLSTRNRAVARTLNAAGYATLLFDLLTPDEERDRANVFDIPLLARRLVAATRWLSSRPDVAALPLAYFGASTGAGAALTAAAELGERVRAVISRGGRPDLATGLADVRAATLLIVGGEDRPVIELNAAAQQHLRCPSELAIVPGASHLFEEPGALAQVASLATRWLGTYLTASAAK